MSATPSGLPARLHPADLAALIEGIAARVIDGTADRVVEALRERPAPPPAPNLIDATEVARRFGVTSAWVRAHADQLGAIPLGEGPRPRLRFDPDTVAAALGACQVNRRPAEPESGAAPGPSRRRRRHRKGTGVELLPIRGASGAAGVESGRPIKSGPGAAGTARGPAPEAEAPARHARYPARAAERPSLGAAPSAPRAEGADMASTTAAHHERRRAG